MSNPIRYGIDTDNRVGSIRTWNQTRFIPDIGAGSRWNLTDSNHNPFLRTDYSIKFLGYKNVISTRIVG